MWVSHCVEGISHGEWSPALFWRCLLLLAAELWRQQGKSSNHRPNQTSSQWPFASQSTLTTCLPDHTWMKRCPPNWLRWRSYTIGTRDVNSGSSCLKHGTWKAEHNLFPSTCFDLSIYCRVDRGNFWVTGSNDLWTHNIVLSYQT